MFQGKKSLLEGGNLNKKRNKLVIFPHDSLPAYMYTVYLGHGCEPRHQIGKLFYEDFAREGKSGRRQNPRTPRVAKSQRRRNIFPEFGVAEKQMWHDYYFFWSAARNTFGFAFISEVRTWEQLRKKRNKRMHELGTI